MRASVGNFCEMPGEHKVVILGEMLELGTENAAAHEEIVRLTQQGNFGRIFLIGNNLNIALINVTLSPGLKIQNRSWNT